MARLARVDAAFANAAESRALPGLVAVAGTTEEILYEAGFGVRRIGDAAPMSTDTVVWIASMTKVVTTVAAMQLVERGRLSLDQPASDVVPELAQARVLDGFHAGGRPRLRPPKRPITLRHLLTHTAGFGYEIWNADIVRYQEATGTPGITTCTNAALHTPLLFDPGERWEYGINIDWAGKMVEAASGERLDVYFRENILGPLGMRDTSFARSPSQRARAATVHQRTDDGTLVPVDFALPENPEFLMGGGGLYATAGDYLTFARLFLGGGTVDGARILRRETVERMVEDHLGALDIPALRTVMPALSHDIELFPGVPKGWGMHFLINRAPLSTGRSAGSLAWCGLANTYFWIDRTRGVAGVFLTQVLPFFDSTALALFGLFETEVYRALSR